MQFLIVVSLIGSVFCAPPGGYGPPPLIIGGGGGGYSGGGGGSGGGYSGGGGGVGGGYSGGNLGGGIVSIKTGGGGGLYGRSCGPGEILNGDGRCERPLITRSTFVYSAPKVPISYLPTPPIPKPRINYNVVFVRTPEQPQDLKPIVVPPPQQKTVIYVLNKHGDVKRQVIEFPAGPIDNPQVFYVNYNKDDENPILPGGFYLQDALQSAETHDGLLVNAGSFESGSGGIGGGIGGIGQGYGREDDGDSSEEERGGISTSYGPPPPQSY